MKRTLLSLLLILTFLLSACANAATATPNPVLNEPEATPNTVTAEGKLLPSPAAELAFVQPGTVAEVLVRPGDQVSAGQVLARLVGSESAQAELSAAQLELTLASQELDALNRNALLSAAQTEQAFRQAEKNYDTQSGRWSLGNKDDATLLELRLDDYVEAEDDFRAARDDLDNLLGKNDSDRKRQDAQKDFDSERENLAAAYSDLRAALAENNQTLDQKKIDLLRSIGALEVAREQLERLDGNLDPDLKAAAESRLEVAQTRVAAAEEALANFELRAPFTGTVLSLDDLDQGDSLIAGVPVAFVGQTRRWQVETIDLAEIDIARVALGQSVTVKLDAFPGEEFPAQVSAIDPVGREHLGDMVYKVTLNLDEADPRFKWNMTATVDIQTR
jgi:HlyD family secretion protein